MWTEFAGRLVFGRLLPKWPYPVLRGPLRGMWFILGAAAGEAGGVSVHLGRVEPEQSRLLLDLLQPGHVFFDVGANVGYYSMLAARRCGPRGSVVAIEPSPRNVAFLYRHVHLNRLSTIEILPLAVAESLGLEVFSAGNNCAVGHLTGAASEVVDNAHRSTCTVAATTSLDFLSERLGLHPDVVKIDVEGAELRVLKGAERILQRGPHILLSVHSASLCAECLDYLAHRGYRVTPLSEGADRDADEFLAVR
jgi:FkbM family methyltransferase